MSDPGGTGIESMLRSMGQLRGYVIRSPEGDVGTVSDLYFSDADWTMRYFVVDTGKWLPGKKVLLSPFACGHPDWSRSQIPVDLTREQVRNCPDFDSARPVSREKQLAIHKFFGWPLEWSGAALPGTMVPGVDPRSGGSAAGSTLRSTNEVLGYRIHATDGEIGHVEDLVAEERHWVVRYLVVDTRNWLPGRKVLVAPAWLRGIDWSDRAVHVELSREEVRSSPEFDPHAPVNRDYEVRLYDYYGRPTYWSS